MTKQIAFIITLLVTLGVFSYTAWRIYGFFRLTKRAFPVKDWGKRIELVLKVAFGQSRIFRMPLLGFFHALVFWGFCVILFGSIEMVIDGVTGSERSLQSLGILYKIIIASGDIFALLVAVSILVFLFRRIFLHVRRFEGIEMKKISHIDAKIALTLILLLMVSLMGMNASYVQMKNLTGEPMAGVFPVSHYFAPLLAGMEIQKLHTWHEIFWWSHILLIFLFANILPYSKHFHVFMSVPNVLLARLDPLGKLPNMDQVTREVKLMLNPDTAFAALDSQAPPERFGVKDCEDVTWKNYLDALSCTECGRCTSVCPANITGKRLSPRKIMMDLRARMKEKGPGMLKHGKQYDDGKSLVRSYITEEELWACTTCNACARECPILINHPTLIVDMRRYLVMEEGSAPGELKAMFSYMENNGAPWQYSPEDRLLWTKDLELNVPEMVQ
ncbi:MAG TPA: 4Fe-4S dicluster domain-containing protein [Bacteroidales bacterium]|nr:4Fe-4S dicluster domain-containing protein [Bacteroidales bacterium]